MELFIASGARVIFAKAVEIVNITATHLRPVSTNTSAKIAPGKARVAIKTKKTIAIQSKFLQGKLCV